MCGCHSGWHEKHSFKVQVSFMAQGVANIYSMGATRGFFQIFYRGAKVAKFVFSHFNLLKFSKSSVFFRRPCPSSVAIGKPARQARRSWNSQRVWITPSPTENYDVTETKPEILCAIKSSTLRHWRCIQISRSQMSSNTIKCGNTYSAWSYLRMNFVASHASFCMSSRTHGIMCINSNIAPAIKHCFAVEAVLLCWHFEGMQDTFYIKKSLWPFSKNGEFSVIQFTCRCLFFK